MRLSERKFVVLYQVAHSRVTRVRYEYRLIEKINGRVTLGATVTATVYALEDLKLIKLFTDGRIVTTDEGDDVLRARDVELSENDESELIDADHS